MKYLFVGFISFYQLLLSPFLHALGGVNVACRYPVSCSEFAKKNIQEKGVIKGGFIAFKRFLSCHPFAKGV